MNSSLLVDSVSTNIIYMTCSSAKLVETYGQEHWAAIGRITQNLQKIIIFSRQISSSTSISSHAARIKGLRIDLTRGEMPARARVCEWHKRIQFAINKMGLVMKAVATPRNTVAYITPPSNSLTNNFAWPGFCKRHGWGISAFKIGGRTLRLASRRRDERFSSIPNDLAWTTLGELIFPMQFQADVA